MSRHPFTMLGTLESGLLFNFSVPAELVRALVPPPLELVTYRGYAFWNVAAFCVRQLRPWPLPRFLGITYRQVAYRLLVYLEPPGGERLSGLYTVRRDVPGCLLAGLANLLDGPVCRSAQIRLRLHGGEATLQVAGTPQGQADAEARVDVGTACRELPPGSRLPDFETALRLLHCAPTTLSYDSLRREIILVRVQPDADPWNARPVKVLTACWNYLADARRGGEALRLEPAFWIGPALYRPQQEVVRLAWAPALAAQPLSALPLTASPARPPRHRTGPQDRPRVWAGYVT